MGDHQKLRPQQPDVIPRNPLEAPPEFSTEPPDFSVLRLETDEQRQQLSPCANCGFAGATNGNGSGSGNSLKRPSPSSVNSQQPKPKKLFLDEPASYPFLRRCISDPYHTPPPQSPPDSVPGISSNTSPTPKIKPNVPDSATPCSVKGSAPASDCPARPPRPPTYRRCLSDTSPSPAKPFSRTSSSSELDKTQNTEKLKKIWQYWKEMNTWMEGFMRVESSEEQTESLVEQQDDGQEDENGAVATTHHDDANDTKNATEDCETEMEESLSVVRDGERLNIHFKCQCRKEYHFLVSDGSCYYKLM